MPQSHIEEEVHDSSESKSQPATVRMSKCKPQDAITIPINREWHALDSYEFDICSPASVNYRALSMAPIVQDVWFYEVYASSEMDKKPSAKKDEEWW